jgi:hypothetical protein
MPHCWQLLTQGEGGNGRAGPGSQGHKPSNSECPDKFCTHPPTHQSVARCREYNASAVEAFAADTLPVSAVQEDVQMPL